MVNFVEGIKRIYIVISVLIGIIYAGVAVSEFPTKERIAYKFSSQVKDAISYDASHETSKEIVPWLVDWGDKSASEFVASACANPFTTYTKEVEVCRDYMEQIHGLPSTRAKYIASAIGIVLVIGVGATILWALLAWIGRGFKQKH